MISIIFLIIIGVIVFLVGSILYILKKMLDATMKCHICNEWLEDYSDKISYCPRCERKEKKDGK